MTARDRKPTTPGKLRPPPAGAHQRLLIVEDEAGFAQAVARALRADARLIDVEHDGTAALERMRSVPYDLIVCDVHLPGVSGSDVLRTVRERDLDLPVILMSGTPTIESALGAVELGAYRYLVKPFELDALRTIVEEALAVRRLARARWGTSGSRGELERDLRAAVSGLRMAYQPVIDARTRALYGYEALMRPSSTLLATPPAVLECAEKLGALHVLGRRVRNLVAAEAETGTQTYFVNVHPADLADPELYEPTAPLSAHARRVVLELTERSSLETIPELGKRLSALRALGYRIAVDDLGAGYAGLSYFAQVAPDFVKIDMSLIRGVDADPVKQRVVLSLVALATGLGMEVVAEGIETKEERECAIRLGCTHLQGYGLGRPGPPYPEITWG